MSIAAASYSAPFLLDANVFIEAHQRHYCYDICPGFWTALLRCNSANTLCSIDKIQKELVKHHDWIKSWVDSCEEDFFKKTVDQRVVNRFADVMNWTQSNSMFTSEAKTRFAAGADGWLIAYASCNGYTLATQEVYEANVKAKIKIPNVCRHFNVPCCNTYDMLRALEVKFGLKKRGES